MSFDQWTFLENDLAGRSVVLAGADDEAALGLVEAASTMGIDFFLVGVPRRIQFAAEKAGVDIHDANLIAVEEKAGEEDENCQIAARLCSGRKDCVLMKGHVGTAAFTRAILNRENGLIPQGALLSHIGLLSDPRNGRPFFLTDAAINIRSDIGTRKAILSNAVNAVRALGIKVPRIAILAPVEKVNQKIASTVDAAILQEWLLEGALGDVKADGPIALDVASSADAAKIKGLDSPVAGKVDIYLAPNLESGNLLYKSLTVFTQARAAGILVGATIPVILPSRSDDMTVKKDSLGLALNIMKGQK